jgi:hypothetical protein
MKLKYPLRVGSSLLAAGTELRPASLEETQKVWPGISYQPGSKQVAAWLPLETDHPIILHRIQVDL